MRIFAWSCVCWGLPSWPRRPGPPMVMRCGATSSTRRVSPHFDYVNPAAPKGGELRLVSNQRLSTFDKYNPFTIKGTAPAYLSDLMFDTLLTGSHGRNRLGLRPAGRGRRRWRPTACRATFRLRPEARFHNGDPVLAADVKHSYDTLIGPHATPGLQDAAGGRGRLRRARRAHRALPLQEAQPRTAADGRRPAGVQPRLGRGKRQGQALRPGGDRHPHRQRALQDRPGALRQGHHLCARPDVLGRATCRCAAAATTSTASPSRSTRTTPRGWRP